MNSVLRCLACVLTLAIIEAGCAETATVESERAKLHGTWEVVAYETFGISGPGYVGERFEFAGEKFRVIITSFEICRWRQYTLKVDASPRQMDWPVEIVDRGKKIEKSILKAIYRVDGDELLICAATLPDAPRPQLFGTKRGEPTELITLKRIKTRASGDGDGDSKENERFAIRNREAAFYGLDSFLSNRKEGKYDADFYRHRTPTGYFVLTERDWQYLVVLRDIRLLRLRACPGVGDDAIPHVSKLTSLETLDLRATEVGDAGVARLAALSNLQTLDLSFTLVTDAGLTTITQMAKLKSVVLEGSLVTEQGVAKLRGARPDLQVKWSGPYPESQQKTAAALERLGVEISYKPDPRENVNAWNWHVRILYVTVQSAPLVGKELCKLRLPLVVDAHGLGGVGDPVFACLQDVKGLVSMNLRESAITDAGLVELQRHKTTLKELDLSSVVRITDAGVAGLTTLTNLDSLGLEKVAVSPATLIRLANLPHLTSVRLFSEQVTDEVKAAFSRKGVRLDVRKRSIYHRGNSPKRSPQK